MTGESMLHFVAHGSPDKPPLMLLHGFLGSAADWDEVTAQLADFFCIAVDLPGHGQSKTWPISANAFDATAQALTEILRRLGVGRCALLGYSMGGRIALHAAVRHPDLFSHLILESASPGIRSKKERAQRREWDESVAKRLLQQSLPSFLQFWYSQPLFRSLQNHVRFDNLMQRRLDNDPPALAAAMRRLGAGAQTPLWEALTHFDIPLLFLAGERDERYAAMAGEIKKIAGAAHVEIIPGCGHNIHFENSAIFCKKVKDFLALKT